MELNAPFTQMPGLVQLPRGESVPSQAEAPLEASMTLNVVAPGSATKANLWLSAGRNPTWFTRMVGRS